LIAVADAGRAVTADGAPPSPPASAGGDPDESGDGAEAGDAGELPAPPVVVGSSDDGCSEPGFVTVGMKGACVGAGSDETTVDARFRPKGPPGSHAAATINASTPASPTPRRGQIERVSLAEGELPTNPMRWSARLVRAIWNRRIKPANTRTTTGRTVSASRARSAQTTTLTQRTYTAGPSPLRQGHLAAGPWYVTTTAPLASCVLVSEP